MNEEPLLGKMVLVVAYGFRRYHGEVVAVSHDGEWALVRSRTNWLKLREHWWHKTEELKTVRGQLAEAAWGPGCNSR